MDIVDAQIFNLGTLFGQVSRTYSERAALKFGDADEVSFGELNRVSGMIADWLLANNVAQGDVVAILHNKTFIPYAIMIACLRIGAVYTNLDTTSPVVRLKKMVETAAPKVVFYGENHRERISELFQAIPFGTVKINYSSEFFLENSALSAVTHKNAHEPIPGSNPAYLMFTSGSTGQPKGVVISHSNVLNFIKWGLREIGFSCKDIFSNLNPMHFDNSVFDFYMSIFTGATLAPVSEDLTRNPRLLVKHLEAIKCTVWFSVPSMLVYALRLRALEKDDLPAMKKIIFGGEGFPKNHLRTLFSMVGHRIELINVYGPTECTCICSRYCVTEDDMASDDLLPLGPLATNFWGFAADDELCRVPDGEVGELLIGGPNVGLGYFRNPEKTAEVFVQNPFHCNYRDIVYRSGDLVRWDAELRLFHFIGRKDNQIKRMGYRIELEEIETALNSIAEIEEATCICVGTRDNAKIIACVVGDISEKKLGERLLEIIPTYMIPNEFKFYKVLPKNQNGKIDRVGLKQEFFS